MNNMAGFFDVRPASLRVLLLFAVPAAALIGLYGRFKGIGTWPLGVDEFYISRSIDHVLATGLPGFPCGGYYTRGLLYQYTVAALRMCGASPEFAGRFVAGLSSLAVLPAAYLLGKRIRGSLAGWLTVMILFLSIWEIEMARFGRMYAPFQAVFAWYVVFYIRYTVDRNAAALSWMVILSIVGILTWEGGVLLGVANLLAVVHAHDRGRLSAAHWRRMAGLLLLLALLYLASRDLRDAAGSAAADPAATVSGSSQLHLLLAWVSALRRHPVWALAFLLPLCIAAASLRFIWSWRSRWLAFIGLSLVLLAALVHSFAAVAGILGLLLLTRLIEPHELASSRGRIFIFALSMLLMFWLAFDLVSGGRSIEFLIGFPDVYRRIAWPWARALPLLTVGVVMAAIFWFSKSIAAAARPLTPVGALLSLLLLMLLAVAAIPTVRIETRYTFFLYPLLVILAVSAILDLAERYRLHRGIRRGIPVLALAASPLLCFGISEDFQIGQVAHIDSAAATFRLGMSPARADHYYPRNDMRGVAAWLAAHIQPADVVVNGIPNLDQYGPSDYFYLDEDDNRYDAYMCRDGRTERWTNHLVLYPVDALRAIVRPGRHVYATLYPDVEERLRREAPSRGWIVTRTYTSMDGKSGVVSITGRTDTAAPMSN
jgi:hypothetical protein